MIRPEPEELDMSRLATSTFAAVLSAGGVVGFQAPAAGATAAQWTVSTFGSPLKIRVGPGTPHQRIGALRTGSPVDVVCQVDGQHITGRVRTTSGWDRLATGGYVSDAYVAGDAPIPSCRLAAPVSPEEYISVVEALARRGRAEYGVPASVTIAQAMLESGLGRSELARQGNSQFGIKCFGWSGPIAVGCRAFATTECDAGSCYPTSASFRVYRVLADSVRDHGRFLRVNSRYAPAFQYSQRPDLFVRAVHQAGYATDPAYTDKVVRLMRTYDLYRFDR